jgi:hypothetical protein
MRKEKLQGSKNGKIRRVGLFIALGTLVAGGAWWGYAYYSKQEHTKSATTVNSTSQKSIGDIRGALEKQQPAPRFTPEDISPEGFNWVHYDFAKIITKSVYDQGFDSVIKEAAAKAHGEALNAYIKTLQNIKRSEFKKWPELHRKSFLLNALHAFQLAHYLEANFSKIDNSHMDLKKTLRLFDKDYSFNSFIKNEILRSFPTREVVLSLHCFSEDCPEFRNTSCNYKNVSERLRVSMNRFMRHREKVKFDLEKKRVILSRYIKKNAKFFPKSNREWAKYLSEFFPTKSIEAELLKDPLFKVSF